MKKPTPQQQLQDLESEYGAAFIVRAVNAYDDLLNAVRLARAYMLDETEETDDNVIDCLAETLRKAEEK